LFAVILDVPGVQLFQLVARPRRRVAQLREQREKGVTAVPAAQPCAPKSGCMTLPEICTDNSGKIQKKALTKYDLTGIIIHVVRNTTPQHQLMGD